MSDSMITAAIGAASMMYLLFYLAVVVIIAIGRWKVFEKAGKPGWGSLVPFYSQYCYFEIAFGNGWLFLLLLVPCVNLVISIMACFKMAKAFNTGVGFGFGLLFLSPIFWLILGFGHYEYVGANA